MPDDVMRCGCVVLVGQTNAGKSTLLNALVQEKVAMVSPKIHSTRMSVMGIVMEGKTQILLKDTVGLGGPKGDSKKRVHGLPREVSDADLVMFVVDGRHRLSSGDKKLASLLSQQGKDIWVVFNKIDCIRREKLLPLTREMLGYLKPQEVFMVSARTGDGLAQLRYQLAQAMPEGPYIYPTDELTDQSDRVFVSEMIREEVLLRVHKEIPYHIKVRTDSFKSLSDHSLRIEATIFVPLARYKSVIIGASGRKLREIGEKTRHMLAKIYGVPCHLMLHVKHAQLVT